MHDEGKWGAGEEGREKFKWKHFEHPPYSPDLSPSEYYLFLQLSNFLAGQSLRTDQEKKIHCEELAERPCGDLSGEGIQTWFHDMTGVIG